MDSVSKGIVYALFGTIFFATKVIFVKLAYHHEVDSVSLLLLRMSFALPFYLASLIYFTRKKRMPGFNLSPKYILILVATALLGYYLSSLFDFIGLRYIDASLERLILYIFPSFVALLSWILFKEKLTINVVMSLVFSYLGLFVVFLPHLFGLETSPEFWTGAFYILLCAVTFALFYIGNGIMIPKMGAIQFTNCSMIIACIAVIMHFFFTAEGIDVILTLPWQVYLYALLMAFISTIIPSYMVSYSIQYIGASRSSIISSFGPIATIALAYIFLEERLNGIQLIGGAIIILSITFLKKDKRVNQK